MSSSPKIDANAADKAKDSAAKPAEGKVAAARAKLQQGNRKIASQKRGTLPYIFQRSTFFFPDCCVAISNSNRLSLRALGQCVRITRYTDGAFESFASMLIQRRFGGGVMIGKLAKRLGGLSVAPTRRATPLDVLVIMRVFGQQLIEETAYDMRAEIIRMLNSQMPCEFMSELQV